MRPGEVAKQFGFQVEQEQPAKYPFLGGELLPQPQPPPLAPEPPQQQPVVVYQELPPQAATASIFVPRTKDMNKGFLTFCEDQPGLTSKFLALFLSLFLFNPSCDFNPFLFQNPQCSRTNPRI